MRALGYLAKVVVPTRDPAGRLWVVRASRGPTDGEALAALTMTANWGYSAAAHMPSPA